MPTSTVRLWDAATGQPVGQPLTGHTDTVISVAFSPDGTPDRLRQRRQDGAGVGRRHRPTVGQPLTGHTDTVRSVAFSPDGTRIVSGSDDKTVRLWDADTGQPVGQPLTGHTSTVYSVAFSPDGTRIVSGSDDNTVRLWDADTGQPVGAAADRPHRRGVQCGVQPRRARGSPPAVTTTRCGCGTPTPANPIGQPLTGHTDRVSECGVQPRRAPDRLRQRRQHGAAVGRRHRPTRSASR